MSVSCFSYFLHSASWTCSPFLLIAVRGVDPHFSYFSSYRTQSVPNFSPPKIIWYMPLWTYVGISLGYIARRGTDGSIPRVLFCSLEASHCLGHTQEEARRIYSCTWVWIPGGWFHWDHFGGWLPQYSLKFSESENIRMLIGNRSSIFSLIWSMALDRSCSYQPKHNSQAVYMVKVLLNDIDTFLSS